MKCFTEQLKVNGVTVPLHAYLPDAAPRAKYKTDRSAVIVFPGGAYRITYEGEGEPIALKYLSAGICAFVLNYSVYPARFPQALSEALTAIRFVRDHAEEYGIDPNDISVCGFSAGGHLAACTGTLWKHSCLDGILEGDRRLYRPDRMILCYPVINPHSHKNSFLNLFEGKEEELTPERLQLLTLDEQVSEDTPPTFLWHNYGDKSVPVETSFAFATALYRHHIPLEFHVYSNGVHGACVGNYLTDALPYRDGMTCEGWIETTIDYLFRLKEGSAQNS